LKKELDNLHLERLLDLSRAKILKKLGLGSWQLLKDKATESGAPLHNYIFASIKEEMPVGIIEVLCSQSFIDPKNIRDLEEAVYGKGGQQSA